MKKKEIDKMAEFLDSLDHVNFILYKGYGFNTFQIKELFEYERFNVMHAIRERYIVPEMSVAQIKEVMLGIVSDHMISMDVKVYANVKYSYDFMRIIRVLIERGIDASILTKIIAMGEFTSKEIFVLALTTLVDKDIESNIRFVKKCKEQVNDLYKAYRIPIRSRKKYSLESIAKSFDIDLNLAKIEYLNANKNESI